MRAPGLGRRGAMRLAGAALALALVGCDRPAEGSPEAVADAFADAYFRRADQEKAKEFTAFTASKVLDEEIRQVADVRRSGYTPAAAGIGVTVKRGKRTARGARVRFDYAITYEGRDAPVTKHADVELSMVHGKWKVVRIGLAHEGAPAPAPSASG